MLKRRKELGANEAPVGDSFNSQPGRGCKRGCVIARVRLLIRFVRIRAASSSLPLGKGGNQSQKLRYYASSGFNGIGRGVGLVKINDPRRFLAFIFSLTRKYRCTKYSRVLKYIDLFDEIYLIIKDR